ncbi:MAG: MATE family efflux transporter [Bacillaceae bacterium]
MKQTSDLGTKTVGKLLMQYSIPAIIGMIVNALYNIVDRIFIGNIPDVGPLAISGVGISMPIITVILAFAMLAGIGATANISLCLGRGEREKAEKTLGNGMTLAVLSSLVLMIVMYTFLDKVLLMFGASEATLVYAREYTGILIAGTIFNVLSFVLSSTVRADGNPRMSAMVMVIGCVINIVLDYVFIFVFGWGIRGAAIATVLSQVITVAILLYYYVFGSSNLKFRKQHFMLNKGITLSIIAIGMSPFAMQIAGSVVQVIANNVLRIYGGDLAIGAMTVIMSVAMLFLMPIFGINQGAQPIIGYNYGAKQYERVKKTVNLCVIAATAFLTIAFFIIQVFPTIIVGMFSNDAALTEMSIFGMRIFLVALPVVGLSVILTNYFQSVGKAKISMLLSLLRQVILLIPAIIILPRFFGLTGVWIAGPTSDIIATTLTVVFYYREHRLLTSVSKKAA